MSIVAFDHISLVVADLDAAIAHFDGLLGLDPAQSSVELDVEDLDPASGEHDVLNVFLGAVGSLWLELMEPVRDDGRLMAHLRHRGPGVHHIGLMSNDIEADWDSHAGRSAELGLVDRCPRVDRFGISYWFLHPAQNFGVLWEVDAAWGATRDAGPAPFAPTPTWGRSRPAVSPRECS